MEDAQQSSDDHIAVEKIEIIEVIKNFFKVMSKEKLKNADKAADFRRKNVKKDEIFEFNVKINEGGKETYHKKQTIIDKKKDFIDQVKGCHINNQSRNDEECQKRKKCLSKIPVDIQQISKVFTKTFEEQLNSLTEIIKDKQKSSEAAKNSDDNFAYEIILYLAKQGVELSRKLIMQYISSLEPTEDNVKIIENIKQEVLKIQSDVISNTSLKEQKIWNKLCDNKLEWMKKNLQEKLNPPKEEIVEISPAVRDTRRKTRVEKPDIKDKSNVFKEKAKKTFENLEDFLKNFEKTSNNHDAKLAILNSISEQISNKTSFSEVILDSKVILASNNTVFKSDLTSASLDQCSPQKAFDDQVILYDDLKALYDICSKAYNDVMSDNNIKSNARVIIYEQIGKLFFCFEDTFKLKTSLAVEEKKRLSTNIEKYQSICNGIIKICYEANDRFYSSGAISRDVNKRKKNKPKTPAVKINTSDNNEGLKKLRDSLKVFFWLFMRNNDVIRRENDQSEISCVSIDIPNCKIKQPICVLNLICDLEQMIVKIEDDKLIIEIPVYSDEWEIFKNYLSGKKTSGKKTSMEKASMEKSLDILSVINITESVLGYNNNGQWIYTETCALSFNANNAKQFSCKERAISQISVVLLRLLIIIIDQKQPPINITTERFLNDVIYQDSKLKVILSHYVKDALCASNTQDAVKSLNKMIAKIIKLNKGLIGYNKKFQRLYDLLSKIDKIVKENSNQKEALKLIVRTLNYNVGCSDDTYTKGILLIITYICNLQTSDSSRDNREPLCKKIIEYLRE